jgi:asparagine synthase (glutamine-hydrolysing)
MCGFVGIFGNQEFLNSYGYSSVLNRMADTLEHRGPDDAGVWFDENAGIGLAHKRLSIIDLSPAGHQPMVSVFGRFVIAFNGEIYNHIMIRTELEKLGRAPLWRGHSDTETLLAGFEVFGVEATLKMCIGMFAFALWDKKDRSLILARDRMGEKPLYFGWQGSANKRVFLFGSELKSLKVHPAFSADIDRGALCLLLRHNYIPAPYSIYQGIAKLEPGCLLTISLRHPEPNIYKYWDAVQVAQAGVDKPFLGTPEEAVNSLEVLAKDAVQQQMAADVPLGAFLSGGIDSSTVVALMQAQSTRPIKTFSIGFDDALYNEAVHAKAVAKHLGTDHTEIYVTPEEARKVIPQLPKIYCEPFADHSQIPNFIVSELARKSVTVSLSGDAGDELFCGYDRYQLTAKLWGKLSTLPLPIRAFMAKCITSVSSSAWDDLAPYIPGARRYSSLGEKLHRGAKVFECRSLDDLYRGVVSQLHNPSDWVIGGREPSTQLSVLHPEIDGLSSVERMMAIDMVSYLPDDILAKVDRAGMAVSLECRVPFLDHRLVEFALSLPLNYKLREGQTKWLLRQVLYRHVPRTLIDRPKMGLGVPLHDWLRGPLRDWAEELLDESRLRREGYFHTEPIRKKWAEHLSGRWNWEPQLWSVLMFQSWLEENT